jgi:hypothetical protein
MFDFKRNSRPTTTTANTQTVGVSSPKRIEKRIEQKREAQRQSFLSESSNGSAAGARIGGLDVNLDTSLLLEGMDSDLKDQQLFRVYRDMYWHDPICGSCVDLYSTLPFSEFSLGGAEDKYLDLYRQAVEVLNLRTAMPRMSVDHQVTGAFCASILYDRKKKSFIDLMCHKYENITVHSLPLYSQDPIMYLSLDPEFKKTLNLPSPRIDQIKKNLGLDFVNKLMSGQVELDPVGTIYVPRSTFSFGEGVSYYKRVLPLWLIEKNLYRGTLIESGRRQRAIMHIMLGEDGWEPTPEDYDQATDLFLDADADPIGAVVATRLGISVSELRPGGDFWKVTDIWDQTGPHKMRGLGISEAFLSGDASYQTMEGAMTVFTETLRAYRDTQTRNVFYDKVFPLVSLMHGLTLRKGKVMRKDGLMDCNTEERLRLMQDGSKLLIPTVHWSKSLKPEQDAAFMDILDRMTAAGIPVPIRMMAAAGGLNLDQLLMGKDEDLAIQRQLLDYKKRLTELAGNPEGGEGGGGGMGSFSSDNNLRKISADKRGHSAILQGSKQSLLRHDYGDASELFTLGGGGKKHHVFNQTAANRQINNKIYKAVREMKRSGNAPLLTSNTVTDLTAIASKAKRFMRT